METESPVLVIGKDYRYIEDGNPRAVVRLINIVGQAPGGKYESLHVKVVHPLQPDNGEQMDDWFEAGKTFTLSPSSQKAPKDMPLGWELKSP